jgi:hypothetical protein
MHTAVAVLLGTLIVPIIMAVLKFFRRALKRQIGDDAIYCVLRRPLWISMRKLRFMSGRRFQPFTCSPSKQNVHSFLVTNWAFGLSGLLSTNFWGDTVVA